MQKVLVILFIILSVSKYSFANQTTNIFAMNLDQARDEITIKDPFQKFNRKIYKFNMVVDKYTLKPAAKTYRKLSAPWFRKGVDNALSNLSMPITLINSILQGDVKNSFRSLNSFVINSTIGVLGIFDPAHQNLKLAKPNKEDFGQTFAKYGIGPGPYLVIPFIGPSSLRHFAGRTPLWAYDPVWDGLADSDTARYSANGIQLIAIREKLLEYLDDIEQNSLDPYSVVKSSYYQRRVKLIKNEVK